ncbi:MAG: hypothetical protein AAB891_01540 [Patescibacteria group bacterium]
MLQYRLGAAIILVLAALVGFFVYRTEMPRDASDTGTTTPPVVS